MADVLLTGYPGLIARKLASHLLNQGDHVRLLTPYRYQQEADQFLRRHTTGTGNLGRRRHDDGPWAQWSRSPTAAARS